VRRSGSRGRLLAVVFGDSLGIAGGQAPRAVEDGEMAARVLVDPDLGLDVVVAVPDLGSFRGHPLVSRGVVASDGALALDAEDIVEVTGKRHEGWARLLGHNGEAFVVLGREALAEEPVPLAPTCLRRWRLRRAETHGGSRQTTWTLEIVKRSDSAKGFVLVAPTMGCQPTICRLK
jgi:hypothetical protein